MKKKARNLLTCFLALIITLGTFATTAMPITASVLGIPPATNDSDVPGIAGVEAAGKDMTATGILALKDVFADKFLIGTTLGTDAHKLYHYNAMTPENNTKPQSIWPNPSGSPSANYRTTVTNTNSYGIYTIGHALAWHNQSNRWPDRSADRPTWNATTGLFTPLTFYWSYNNADPSLSANAQLERYISTMAGVFTPGQTYGFDAWDVVNEMMRDNPEHPEDWRNALRRGSMPMMRPSNWYGSYAQGGNGYDYVYDAYRWARQYFPNTILNINDFNDEELPNKAIAIAELVKELNARYAKEHPEDPRKLIEMIGIQGHYNTRMDLNNLEDNIQTYIETGCQIEITELDVSIPKPSGATPTTAQLQEQARFYARLFRLLNKYSDYIHRVSWWGAADNANWRSGFHPMIFSTTSGNTVNGVNRGTPKEAYWATIYPELYLGIPVEPPKLKSFNFGGDNIDVGIVPKYDVNVPKDISNIEFGAGNLVFDKNVDIENVDISVTLSNGGAVSAGKPCVATVKLRWKNSPNNADNTTTYKISFGHMSAEWISDWNYSDTGYRSAVNVRFSDGETKLILRQEFTALDGGEVVLLNSKEFSPLPKHGKGTFAVATESKLSDEYLSTVQLSKSVLDAETGLPFIWTDVGHLGTPDFVWKLNKDPLEPGKTYIIVSSNSGLALTHEGRSPVQAAGGTTSAVQGYFGTDIVTENDIITKTFVAQNKIESPIQDHLRFWFKPLTHPNPGKYTAENGYIGFGLQSLVHGGLIEPFFIHRDATTTYPNTLRIISNTHITHENLDQGVWFNTPIDPVTGETTLFLYTPGETEYYYGLAGNQNGFVAERIMDINNPGDLFKVKTYEYVYVDTKAPILTIPADVTTEAEGELTSVDFGEASATDYSAFTITNNAPENGRFPIGETEIIWTATDIYENTAEAIQKVSVVDTIASSLEITSPANEASYLLNQPVTAEWSTSDFGSGIASTEATVESGELIDTSKPGEHEFTVTVTDNSGNVTTKTVTYHVGYIFDGVIAPLEMNKENTVNLGSAIPVKFALKDFNGSYVSSANADLYCAPVASGTVGEYLPAFSRGGANKNSAFRFSVEDNQYIFNMDTKGLAAGFYRLKIVLDDSQKIEIDVTNGAPIIPVPATDFNAPENFWRLAKTIESGKTYIVVSVNSGLALTDMNVASVPATGGVTSAKRGLAGTDVTTADGIIIAPELIQDNMKFIFTERTSPDLGPYTRSNGYTGYTMLSLVHGGLVAPSIIWRDFSTDMTAPLRTDATIADSALDRAVWFNTGIDPDTGETTLFLHTGSSNETYALHGNESGFVGQGGTDPLENYAAVSRVQLYEYVSSLTPFAMVERHNSTKNRLTVTVTELYSDGSSKDFTEEILIGNNAADVYQVGPYKVYVDTKGSGQIRECYIVW